MSTRQLLSAAWKIAAGGDPKIAVEAAVQDGYYSEGGAASERAKVQTHVAGIAWTEPKPQAEAASGSLFTGTGVCTCSHGPEAHGIGTVGTVSTYCRTCAALGVVGGTPRCAAYSEVMVAEDGSVAVNDPASDVAEEDQP